MTAADHATAVQLLRSAAADHLTHLDPAERDELVERITGALDRCARRRAVAAIERAALVVEAQRPHIPPSTDPGRRTAVIVRSTLNRAARAIRADALEAE